MVFKKIISRLMMGKIVYKVKTKKDYKTTIDDLKKAIANNGFQVKHIHDIREAFDKKGLKYSEGFEYKLIQFCNAEKAYNALSKSTDVGIMMPKTIIAFRKNNETYLQFMKMKPFMVKFMFPEINLAPMSKKVMATMAKIVHEAA
ncbi:MAG: DUF302 domain-containing protein [Nanobdellota archaeon]